MIGFEILAATLAVAAIVYLLFALLNPNIGRRGARIGGV